MSKKPCTEMSGLAGSSSAKKANVASKAESAAASKITVTLDLKLLNCSVCRGELAPPLFQCTNGHMTCLACYEFLDHECSWCDEPNITRCRSVEDILDGMTVPCSFRQHGCTDMIPFTNKMAHEESCPHAPCYCPIVGCPPYAGRSLRDHINLQHPTIKYTHVTAGNFCPVQMSDGEPARFVYLGGRPVFLLVVDRSVPSGRSLSVIHLANEPAGVDDFKYKIQVYTRKGIFCLSGDTQRVGRLMKPYQPGATLFVLDAMWSPQYSPVYIKLKK